MGDILREALAEAKLVKKVAIEAAKEQLNEALTPKIESMLSNKIREEMDTDDDEELDETEDPGKSEEGETKDDKDVTPALSETEDPGDVTDMESDDNQDVTPDLKENDGDEDEDDKEIEEILKELEDDETDNDDEINMSEDSEDFGNDNTPDVPEEDKEDDELEEDNLPGMEDVPGPNDDNEDDDEDINVEEILSSLDEEEYSGDDNDEEKDKEQQNVVKTLESKVSKLSKRLSEYKKVVGVLKNELSEVNLLNNKLFHTTKLLKKFNVSNKTKMGIIEQFDRAKTVREVKLIYTTLYESLKPGSRVESKPKITSLREVKQKTNSASKSVFKENYNPDPTILTEGDELKARFQKLAGVLKG